MEKVEETKQETYEDEKFSEYEFYLKFKPKFKFI